MKFSLFIFVLLFLASCNGTRNHCTITDESIYEYVVFIKVINNGDEKRKKLHVDKNGVLIDNEIPKVREYSLNGERVTQREGISVKGVCEVNDNMAKICFTEFYYLIISELKIANSNDVMPIENKIRIAGTFLVPLDQEKTVASHKGQVDVNHVVHNITTTIKVEKTQTK